MGCAQTGSLGLTWRLVPRFDDYYYFNRPGGPETGTGKTAIASVNHLQRLKVNCQFRKAPTLRAILDCYFLTPNEPLFDSTRFKSFTSNILLTYLLNPGTALHAGYNDRFQNLDIDPDTQPTLRRYGPSIYLTGCQFFMKLSYLLRFRELERVRVSRSPSTPGSRKTLQYDPRSSSDFAPAT